MNGGSCLYVHLYYRSVLSPIFTFVFDTDIFLARSFRTTFNRIFVPTLVKEDVLQELCQHQQSFVDFFHGALSPHFGY